MFIVNDLHIGYAKKKRQTTVASNITFQTKPGTFMAIVGVNGIGKSTLLRTLGRMQSKISGEILLANTPIEKYTAVEWAKKISVVLTEPIASKNLTVIELIALGRQPYTNWIGALTQTDNVAIEAAIEKVGLADLKQKKCFELSDGQLQKVMLARAITQDTDIILLDEPSTHLDLFHKVHILKLLRSLAHETGKTIVFTTHEIDMAIQLCDAILIMGKEKQSFGTPKALQSAGIFHQLFPEDTVIFDSKTSTFKVNK